LGFSSIPVDRRGKMDLDRLEDELRKGDVGTVVATLGTTAIGSVDPLDQILQLRAKYGFKVHVDAAYGGYFSLISNLFPETKAAFKAVGEADSIVIDQHTHGLQPYGCGCVLFSDPADGRFYKHDSPYTYFSSAELHLGEITLECSRAGAAAAALWATQKLLPLVPDGNNDAEFARSLGQCRAACLAFHARLLADGRFIVPLQPELDILVWGVKAASVAEASRFAQQIFDQAASRDLHLALVKLPLELFPAGTGIESGGSQTVTCLRSVLMKPEHLEWLDRIWKIFSAAAEGTLKGGPRPLS